MDKKGIKNAAWYPAAVAICIGVVLYILLSHLSGVLGGIGKFIGYFRTPILGCVIAYLVNPLAGVFSKLLKGVKKDKLRRTLSNALAFLSVILFLIFAVATLIPQIASSIETFINNLDGYITSANAMIGNMGLSGTIDLASVIGSAEDIMSSLTILISNNFDKIVSTSASAGKGAFQLMIAFMLAMYLLAEKDKLKAGFSRLLKASFGKKRYSGISTFLHKCDAVFNRYIVFNLIDSLIVGVANALFMMVCGMQYIGLISFIVAVTNLIPTFGPMIGGVIGGFVLLMVNPLHALLFLIFTVVLQIADGYVIKPKLFGDSLGVSGLWILVGVIVGGSMFGVIGILLAIPAVAIIDFIYKSYILEPLEKRSEITDAKSAEA